MTQPIIVDQAKYQEVREATDFMAKFRDLLLDIPAKQYPGQDNPHFYQ